MRVLFLLLLSFDIVLVVSVILPPVTEAAADRACILCSEGCDFCPIIDLFPYMAPKFGAAGKDNEGRMSLAMVFCQSVADTISKSN